LRDARRYRVHRKIGELREGNHREIERSGSNQGYLFRGLPDLPDLPVNQGFLVLKLFLISRISL
jgi:hypothetical protein